MLLPPFSILLSLPLTFFLYLEGLREIPLILSQDNEEDLYNERHRGD